MHAFFFSRAFHFFLWFPARFDEKIQCYYFYSQILSIFFLMFLFFHIIQNIENLFYSCSWVNHLFHFSPYFPHDSNQ